MEILPHHTFPQPPVLGVSWGKSEVQAEGIFFFVRADLSPLRLRRFRVRERALRWPASQHDWEV